MYPAIVFHGIACCVALLYVRFIMQHVFARRMHTNSQPVFARRRHTNSQPVIARRRHDDEAICIK